MKTIFLLVAISIGVFFPYGSSYTFLIRYFLMLMLFFSFLDIRLEKEIIRKSHFTILASILLLSAAVYLILNSFNAVLAQTAFVTAIAPTAIAAPVIISLKKKNVAYVTFSLLLNNTAIALLLPLLLPLIINSKADISVGEILWPVIITLSIPFALAQLIKYFLPAIWKILIGLKDSSFYILVLNIYLASSEASHFIGNEMKGDVEIVFFIALISAVLCILFFITGRFLGGKEFSAEAGQSLGQKNNAFTIWISVTFVSPLAVLGPVFYALFQNIYISWELYRHNLLNSGSE